MSHIAFASVLLVGAATVAAWVAARFPVLAPRTPRGVMVRVLVALICLGATAPAFAIVRPLVGQAAAVVLVALSSGVALVLAMSWLVLWIARAVASPSR